MAKTISKEDVKVIGGPLDGMRMLAHVKDDGTVEIQGARIFAPDGLDGYRFDSDAMELVYLENDDA